MKTKLHIFRNFRYELLGYGLLVGVCAGALAVAFRFVLGQSDAFLERVVYAGENSVLIKALWIAAVCGVSLIITHMLKWEPRIGGGGIPQVMGELEGEIDENWLKVLTGKFTAVVLGMFCGLSIGRMGPSVQIGAMAAKGVSRLPGKIRSESRLLINCGAGAALAAAFNAPFAGVLFALETLHKGFNADVMISTMAASVTADFISHVVFGENPVFVIQVTDTIPLDMYWILLILGIVLGAAGRAINYLILLSNKLYSKIKHTAVKSLIPYLCAGILTFVFPIVLGGGGNLLLRTAAAEFDAPYLMLILGVKLAFFLVCFGSGVPGGMFLPLLSFGALMGAACGAVSADNTALVANFAILAMAGVFSASVRAPLTGIILMCEITGTFNEILPLTLVCVLAYTVSAAMGGVSVYEALLNRMLKREAKQA